MIARHLFSFSRYLVLAVVLVGSLTALAPVSLVKADSAVVTFPDSNLEAAIREATGKPTGDVYESDLVGLSTLSADGRGIVDLTGLEYCTSLTSLYLQNNQVVDISPLSGLTNLSWLSLHHNKIANLLPLSGLTNLTGLSLGFNQIIDLSPLSGLTNLTRLYLYNNGIIELSPLSGLTNVKEMLLSNNQIGNLTPLAGLTNLTYLSLVGNQITDLSSLSGLKNLTGLRLDDNQIVDLTALSGLTSLTELGLEDNGISGLSPLSNLTSLTRLYLSANQISDLSPLSGLISLSRLSLEYNQISDIAPLAGLTNLIEVLLDYNQISNLTPLSGLTSLWGLSLEYDQISDLQPLVDNPGLASGDVVELRGNPLNANSVNACIPALEGRGVLVTWDTVDQSPAQPSNVTPADGSVEVSPTPTLESSEFSDPDTSDTHAASHWQVTTVPGDYSGAVFDSGTNATHLLQITLEPALLTGNRTYYWHVRYQDNHGDWSSWSNETSFATLNPSPDQPANVSPANGATRVSLTPTLQSSTFFDPDGDTHAASHWQVSTAPGDYSSAIFDSSTDASHLLQITLSSSILSANRTYYWHVRHQDNRGGWSDWSAETSFTTLNQPPDQPANVSPANGAAGVSLTPTLQSSAFSDPDTATTHAASQWQLTAVPGDYSSPVFDSGTDADHLLQFTLSSSVLNNNGTYYWRVRHQDNFGTWSAWSAETIFTTLPLAPSVTADEAASVGTNSARISGNLASLGTASSVTISFVWGTSSGSYPNETSGQVLSGAAAFYFDLSSLTPGTTYYYKVKAVGHGITYGLEESFTTGTTAPLVITDDASSITTNSAKLNGNLTLLGTASSVTVSFVWGTTSGGPYTNDTASQAMIGTGAFCFDLGGLSPGTFYYYKAKVVGHGDAVYGAEKSFTTGRSPEIESLDPVDGKRKQHLTITITGANFNGATSVSFGFGITVENFSVNSSTEITAEITVDADAAKGSRDVSVTTGWGTATKTDGFSVVGGGGGICSGGALATPGVPSEMTTVLAALGLLLGLGYLFARRGARNRRDSISA